MSEHDDKADEPGRKHRDGDGSQPTDEDASTEFTGSTWDTPTEITTSDPSAPDAPTELAVDAGGQATEVTSAPTSGRNPLAAMRPGYVLKDRFKLEAKLGSGAMGAVFRAVDQRRVEAGHHHTHVALKLIASAFAQDSRAFVALQREADKSQTLAHPNIITVYDFDRDGDIFYMTMESLVGMTLDGVIAEDGLSRVERLSHIVDMANAIAYAHRRNIVHSDLKPPNVFVTEDGTLKVLDFGIARAFAGMDEQGEPTRDTGEIVGLTPAYASCEMFEGQEPHPADDVYAIGLIAYELLTGEHPFGRRRATDARTEGLKPKRIRGLKRYQWQAIATSLAFDRADRWADAEVFRRKFVGVGRTVRQLSAALLLALAGFGAYLLLYEPAAGPDIPFEELSPEKQEAFNEFMSEGQTAAKFGDVNGALFYFDKAYRVHPRNPRVVDEIDALLDRVFERMDAESGPDARARHIEQLQELQKYEALEQNARLQDKLEALANGAGVGDG
ncbi:serine/threonine-protein kinase [Salinisphaera sp. P385]|uniref:Serine/threonine-protein kinase n=1 Tax=Spectribacter acetivorans TaxID=3075603 RepID=A0ABU3B9D3_9GAMM|nr:serine/threonine-protein kinase [Salinisphaera sp. P385]MDT0618798.1 serine/threonine-protein kinase [Salinisphaera sp. P385]